jgi:SAM-dependent methyltransferase
MDNIKIRNKNQFDLFVKSKPDISNRKLVEDFISRDNFPRKTWFTYGYCECCKKPTKFFIDRNKPNCDTPNFREGLICKTCGLNNRQRFMAKYIVDIVMKGHDRIKTIYCYERLTNIFSYLQITLNDVELIGSEFLGYDKKPGAKYINIKHLQKVRHENALVLSFDNQSIDLIVSNDVFEHIPDIHKALKEAYRSLKEDGILLFSIPFNVIEEKSHLRATLKGSEIVHLKPEQYHGNPLSSKGSLVFYDFGWDILTFCKEAGFKEAWMLAYYSYIYGYWGDGLQYIFYASKSKASGLLTS